MPRPEIESLNLPETILVGVQLYSNTPNVDVKFENEMGAEVFVDADRKQLIRSISNLVKNAIQAIPRQRKGEILVRLHQEIGQIKISITDNGKGIPEHEQEKIFEPYFTTKSGGTGLGLAMVKNMLKEFGASISFETIENEGTTFTIVFN